MAPLSTVIANGAKRGAYGATQAARILWFTGHYAYGRRKMGPLTEPGAAPYAEEFAPLDRERLKNAFRELFQRDWKNIETGQYKMPVDLRQRPSFAKLWKQSRDYLSDADKVARRKAAKGHSEVYSLAYKEKFPRYYLQNFHYQTDGWMSESSADRYDMQVETLFTGAAGPMRRQALPFIKKALEGKDASTAHLLDLGCGTGRFLGEVKDNWPQLNVTALDLSPAYIGKARANLGRWKDIAFVQENAEATGLPDASCDIVTAVYLFHELPPAVRKRVAAEIARVLKPGGILVQVDTIQYGDEPGLDILLENFPRGFHEPYYDSYCREDLQSLFADAGLDKQDETLAFLTKVTGFKKPV
ncbi:class I SAM-dependent methyltransferase [Hyphococcus flavus]|uniref:Class I SAM-dependent methyltransferase n=1 Tax=Hyphococcus flavus TaxID=1866326 RepID=A0AAF0CEH8_9PROT|nr:class I SAM-dependent methyltransferase [Hyphococcus flavus]WDI30209.1 class I SAM-dependent methyltransferase [Hyphococcus flavus]